MASKASPASRAACAWDVMSTAGLTVTARERGAAPPGLDLAHGPWPVSVLVTRMQESPESQAFCFLNRLLVAAF